jgi:hypothetical protein
MALLLNNLLANLPQKIQSMFKIYDRFKYINLDLKFSSAVSLPRILRDLLDSSIFRSELHLKLIWFSNHLSNNVTNSLIAGSVCSFLTNIHGPRQSLLA